MDKIKAKAFWSAYLKVECPCCAEDQKIEFDNIDEWWEIFPHCECKENIGYNYTCVECGKEFIIDSTCW